MLALFPISSLYMERLARVQINLRQLGNDCKHRLIKRVRIQVPFWFVCRLACEAEDETEEAELNPRSSHSLLVYPFLSYRSTDVCCLPLPPAGLLSSLT